MKVYFIEDENGEYYSTDKTRRFKRLAGKEAFEFLREERKQGIQRRFFQTESEEIDGASPFDEVNIEVSKGSISIARVDERRKQYNSDCEKKSGIETISLSAPFKEHEELTIEDIVPDALTNVEDEAIHEIELEMLRRALKTLSVDELRIIHSLYLSGSKATEEALAKEMKLTQQAINKRKECILKKTKKNFNLLVVKREKSVE